MDYHKEFIVDFARRTHDNLEYIEAKQKQSEDLFEVTQLVNSLLGLLVFPRERDKEKIYKTQLKELREQGWPKFETVSGKLKKETLSGLVDYMRHGIAHCNVKFLADENSKLTDLEIWNKDPNTKQVLWRARIKIGDLRLFVLKMLGMLERNNL